jgi:hypothetical protein
MMAGWRSARINVTSCSEVKSPVWYCCFGDLVLVYVAAHDVHCEGRVFLRKECFNDMVSDESAASYDEHFNLSHDDEGSIFDRSKGFRLRWEKMRQDVVSLH